MRATLMRCDATHPAFQTLIRELDKELRSYSSDHEEVYISHNIVPDNVQVTLVFQGETAVGCACLRPIEKHDAELKRMYVRPTHRGKGLSRLILEDLEILAGESGYHRILLETGLILKEATGLYRSAGYSIIENYGPYKGISESICFEKRILV